MKKILFVLTAMVTLAFVSCKENPYMPSPGDNGMTKNDTMPEIADPDPTPDPEGIDIPEGTINVFEAIKIAKKLKSGEVTEESYYIKGWVTGFNRGASFAEDFPKYGNDFVYISAVNDGTSDKSFYAYRLLGKGGAKLPDLECILLGDFIVINCKITNYSGVYESSGSCVTARSTNEHFNEVFPPFPGCPEPGPGEISVNRAIEIADSIGTGNTTKESYKIRGVVTGVSDASVSSYGNLTFNISSDGDFSAVCYRMMAKDSAKFASLDQLQVGDTVLVKAKIQNYNGTCEPVQGYVVESTNPNFAPEVDPTKITPDPEGADVPEGTLNVYEARHICDSIGKGKTTAEEYYVKGWIHKVVSTASEVTQYGNATFYIAPTNDGTTNTTDFEAYRIKSIGGAKFTSLDEFKVGDFVVIQGKLKNYNGTFETGDGANLYYSNNPAFNGQD